MDRIITIASCQWRAFWRRFRRVGQLGAGNQAIILIFAVLILARYLQSLQRAANDLPLGKTRVFESLLFVVFLVWLFPLASNARVTLALRKLLHLPLSFRELFSIKLFNFFIPPYSWVAVIGSLAISYPIIKTPHPVAGVLAALLFILFSAFTGITVAQLLTIPFWRRLFLAGLLLGGVAAFYLLQTESQRRVVFGSSLLPTGMVTQASLGHRPALVVGKLILLAIISLLAALWSFKRSLAVTAKHRSQRLTLLNSLRLPGPIGGLVVKDFRYFRRLLDPYLGLLAAAIGSLYLISAEVVSAGLFLVLLLLVIFPSSALTFNFFGLDNRGVMDRLRILPVNGTTILLSKHVAFLMLVLVQTASLILLAGWRLGPAATAIGLAQVISVTAMCLAWGNWMSLNHPVKLHFFQFSSSNGLIVEALAGMIFGSLPGVLNVYLLQTAGMAGAWKVVLVLCGSGLIYIVSLWHFSGKFSLREDAIHNAVS